jgi:hypothetical protein
MLLLVFGGRAAAFIVGFGVDVNKAAPGARPDGPRLARRGPPR